MAHPSFEVLAIQAEMIRRQVDDLRRHARHLPDLDRQLAAGHCAAVDLLLGQVWATLHAAANSTATTRPECHRSCGEAWDDRAKLTAERAEVARG